jgi:hypothetical protein
MGQRAFVLGAGGHDATAWELGVITGMADAGVDGRDATIYEQISLSIFPKRVFNSHAVNSTGKLQEPKAGNTRYRAWHRSNLDRSLPACHAA